MRERFGRVRRESGPLWALTLAIDRVVPFGILRLWRPSRVPAALLREQAEAILRAWGLSDEHVAITVEKMLYADLRGIDGHGCSMLPSYRELLVSGHLNPRPAIEIVREGEATVLIDGGGGLGHVPAKLAMEEAIDRCRTKGVGVASVRNSGHCGAAGAYAALAAEQGLIGVATTGTPSRTVVPTFGQEPMLGTNPIAVAAPAARNRPFLLDMATSTVSLGKVVQRWRSGRRIPRGWALNDRGRSVRSGSAAIRNRRLSPLGGDQDRGSYKGYGLGLAVEILSTLLPGVAVSGAADGSRPVGHFFLAIDPGGFREGTGFAEDLDSLIDEMHAGVPVRPQQPVLVPGDPEERIRAERSARGIPLAKDILEELRAVAAASNVPFILDRE